MKLQRSLAPQRLRRRSHAVPLTLAWLVAVLLVPMAPTDAVLATTPADFQDVLVTQVGGPTALAFTPDGRMLITSHFGTLFIYDGRTNTTTAALDYTARICSDQERGLLGVAVDPTFASDGSSGFIYLYYTYKKFGDCPVNASTSPVNRVSRFVLRGNAVDSTTELVLIDNMPQPGGIHSAGDLHFGKDGYLYVTVGDGGCDLDDGTKCGSQNDNARQTNILLGKVLRITRDGAIPADNPYQGSGSARCNLAGRTDPGLQCQETFASGLRNPFRFAFDPNAAGTRFYIDDTGQNTWEEIDLGQAGADYGWNVREGHCARNSATDCGPPPAGMTNPVYDYQHGTVVPTESTTACNAITGGAFVPAGIWPAAYDGSYLYGDFTCGTIFRLAPAGGGGFTRSEFVTGLGNQSAVVLAFGPYGSAQALYYTTYNLGGQIRRVTYTGNANRAPIAQGSANPTSGPLPLTVSFDGTPSSDPDGDPLTYEWNFGDASPLVAGSAATHTYTTAGTFPSTLTVRDGRGGTASASFAISAGNQAPVPSIVEPTTATRFRVGQTITLRGTATDPEDGTLADSALSWVVIRHHDTHSHPFLGPTAGNNISFLAPAPEDLAAANNSYLEIRLTATDSKGLSQTTTQDLLPNKVTLTLNTQPSGLNLVVNGTTTSTPSTFASWEGYQIGVDAPAQSDQNGQPMEFVAWSDGGAASHVIVTPAASAAYTATFQPAASKVVSFAPEADARVEEANPTTNYGTSTYLRADGGTDPDIESVLRFAVSGLTGPVQSAKLRLFGYNGTNNGPAVYATTNSWTETGITWNTRPGRTSGPTDDKGAIPDNSWVEYNVTPLVSGNGTVSFILATTSADALYTWSRENITNRPELVISTGTGDAEAPTAPSALSATAQSSSQVGLAWTASTDNVAVAAYEIYRNGSLLATISPQTAYTDGTVQASTTYSYAVKARDAAGNLSAASNTASVTTPASSNTTVTFTVSADARVTESLPTKNYGTSTRLRADGGTDPDVESYLRVSVAGLPGAVQSAKLRLFATSGTANGPAVYTAGSTWTELGLTWSNRPAVTAGPRDDKAAISSGTWFEFDVTPFVSGNGTYTFVVRTTSTDGIDFSSREATTNRPQLVVTVAAP